MIIVRRRLLQSAFLGVTLFLWHTNILNFTYSYTKNNDQYVRLTKKKNTFLTFDEVTYERCPKTTTHYYPIISQKTRSLF